MLGYSQIEIDQFADSLLKLQIKIGVHLISVELSQLLTLIEITSMEVFGRSLLLKEKKIHTSF